MSLFSSTLRLAYPLLSLPYALGSIYFLWFVKFSISVIFDTAHFFHAPYHSLFLPDFYPKIFFFGLMFQKI